MTKPVINESLSTISSNSVATEWVDIIGPMAPAHELSWLWIVAILCLLSLTGFILYIWSRQPHVTARLQLHILNYKLSGKLSQEPDYRVIAHQVARIINRATEVKSQNRAGNTLTKTFLTQLDHACYAPVTISHEATCALIGAALDWLEQEKPHKPVNQRGPV